MPREHYLIVKLGAMGDVLVATALVRALRSARPQARIGMLTSSECAPLLEGNPDLDETVCVEVREGGLDLRPAPMLRLLCSLAAWSEGTAVIAHRHPLFAVFCRLAGFRQVVGFSRRWNPFLTRAAAFDVTRHRMERQEDLLHCLDIDAGARQMRIVLTGRELAFGESAWRRMRMQGPRLVLAPGGGKNRWSEMPNRRWPAANFRQLAAWAAEAGLSIQIIGSPADLDCCREVAAERPEIGMEGVGAWSVREAAAVIAAAHLVVSNDSLALFLAAAMQTPVLGLYGPTDSRLIHPPCAGQALQGAAGCGPCFSPFDGKNGEAYRCARSICMESLTPDAVWYEVRRWLPSFACAASSR